MDIKWELGVLLDCYTSRIKDVDKHDYDKKEKIKNLYAQAILLNVEHGYGLFFPIDDFIKRVDDGYFIDYDGFGKLLDANGKEIGYSKCNVPFLKKSKTNGAIYVAWFNK